MCERGVRRPAVKKRRGRMDMNSTKHNPRRRPAVHTCETFDGRLGPDSRRMKKKRSRQSGSSRTVTASFEIVPGEYSTLPAGNADLFLHLSPMLTTTEGAEAQEKACCQEGINLKMMP